MKRNFWLPIFLGFFVSLIYGLRKIDPQFTTLYFPTLYLAPLILLILRKTSFPEMGIRLGKPLDGFLIVFLLPVILFLRFKTMGKIFFLASGWQGLIYGSIGEEVFFRGYLQGQFDKAFGSNLSVLMTNFFFMLVHIVKGYSLAPALMTFIIGVYFSIGRHPKGGDSLVWSSIAHPLYNLVATAVLPGV